MYKKQFIKIADGKLSAVEYTADDYDLVNNYYGSKILSNSSLSRMTNGLYNYLMNREKQITTKSMSIGSAAHSLLLGGDSVEKLPDGRGFSSTDTKAAIEYIADFREKAGHDNNIFLSSDDFRAVQEMNNALMENKFIKEIFNSCVTEKPLIMNKNGLTIKGKPDAFDLDKKIIIDYKTTKEVPTIDNINKIMYNFAYYRQAALYTDLLFDAHLENFEFYFLFQCTAYPYEYNMVKVPDYAIEYGRANLENNDKSGYIDILNNYRLWLEMIDKMSGEFNIEYLRFISNTVTDFHDLSDCRLPAYARIKEFFKTI